MLNTLDELKDLLASKLDITDILDLLDLSEREVLDYLDDVIQENRETIVAAL